MEQIIDFLGLFSQNFQNKTIIDKYSTQKNDIWSLTNQPAYALLVRYALDLLLKSGVQS